MKVITTDILLSENLVQFNYYSITWIENILNKEIRRTIL